MGILFYVFSGGRVNRKTINSSIATSEYNLKMIIKLKLTKS